MESEAVQTLSLSCMALLVHLIEFYPLTKILVIITIKSVKEML